MAASTSTSPSDRVAKAINAVLDSLYSSERGSRGEKALKDILSCSASKDKSEVALFNKFCSDLLRHIESCCSKCGSADNKTLKERSIVKFHHTRVENLWPLWKKVFKDLGIACVGSAALVQTVNRHIFNETLVTQLKVSTCTEASEPEVFMTAMEENAVRYSAGFVSLKLLKKFEKQGTDKAADFVECLSNMAVGGDDSR